MSMVSVRRSVAFLAFFLATSLCFAQGDLTPPGPPTPIMKTLDQIEPRRPIHARNLPVTINHPGSYYLAENINFNTTNTDGITIASDNVSIDLMGFTLRGPGRAMGQNGSGIAIKKVGVLSNLHIHNGKVVEWRKDGINFYIDEADVAISSKIENVFAEYNGDNGILNGYACEVANCISIRNKTGIKIGSGVVDRCIASDNSESGINVGPAQTLYAETSLITNCRVNLNLGYGIWLYTFTTVRGCHIGYNGMYLAQPQAGSAGIYVKGTNNVIKENQLIDNSNGIVVAGSHNYIMSNISSAAVSNYIVSSSDVVGPIVTGFGTITTNNSWANFSNSVF